MAERKRPLRQLGLLSLCLILWSCSGAEIKPIPPAPVLSFEELKQRVSRIRGLPFQHEIALEIGALEEIRSLVEKAVIEEHEDGSLELTARAFVRLGLLPEKTDYSKALAELRLYQRGLYDSARRRTIMVPRSGATPGVPLLASPQGAGVETQRQLLQVYALTRILQEQNFAWPEKLKRRKTEDSALAFHAFMKGDAALVGSAHLLGSSGENRQKIIEELQALFHIGAQTEKDLAHLPELLRLKAAFEQVQGSQFVMWAYSLKGWEGVNGLYSDPPQSTKQILHPEKFYSKREDPLRITPWGLLRQMEGNKIMEETLGELLIQVLLSRTLSQEEAVQAAAGWAGDSLLVFQQDNAMVLAWVTAWENSKEAMEFFRSYRRSLERRHRISLEPAEPSVEILIAPARSNQRFLLQIRENFVFFLDGVAPPRSLEIAKGLWNELETGVEPQPFEIAGQGDHAPAARR